MECYPYNCEQIHDDCLGIGYARAASRFGSSAWSLFQLPPKLIRNETANVAAVMAKTTLRPAMYAATTPGTSAGAKDERISVAPVTRTVAGSTPGAVDASAESILLLKPDCAAERQNDPPIIWKTDHTVISLRSRRAELGR